MSLLLKEQDIQTLCDVYELPRKVEVWLNRPDTFEAAHEYEFHERLCDLHPEDSLICISLCLEMILRLNKGFQNDFKDLKEEISSILRDYGQGALKRSRQNKQPDEDCDIQSIAADLTKLGYMLESLEPLLSTNQNNLLNIIFSTLSIQTGAQAEIARYALSNVWKEGEKSGQFERVDVPYASAPPANDNQTCA